MSEFFLVVLFVSGVFGLWLGGVVVSISKVNPRIFVAGDLVEVTSLVLDCVPNLRAS